MHQLAIDIGNSRIKLGLFAASERDDGIWQCRERIALPIEDPGLIERIGQWLAERPTPAAGWIGSVNPSLLDRILNHWPSEQRRAVLADRSSVILPANHTRFPERVGSDRLFNAVAANAIRRPGQPAIIVDSGTATKVDFVDAEGGFRGGSILAGFDLIANALHDRTAQLPRIETQRLATPPDPVGNDTESALRSGLYWGIVGAVRELTNRMTESVETAPVLLLTGGAAPLLEPHFQEATYAENLTLQGILLAGRLGDGGRESGELIV